MTMQLGSSATSLLNTHANYSDTKRCIAQRTIVESRLFTSRNLNARVALCAIRSFGVELLQLSWAGLLRHKHKIMSAILNCEEIKATRLSISFHSLVSMQFCFFSVFFLCWMLFARSLTDLGGVNEIFWRLDALRLFLSYMFCFSLHLLVRKAQLSGQYLRASFG